MIWVGRIALAVGAAVTVAQLIRLIVWAAS